MLRHCPSSLMAEEQGMVLSELIYYLMIQTQSKFVNIEVDFSVSPFGYIFLMKKPFLKVQGPYKGALDVEWGGTAGGRKQQKTDSCLGLLLHRRGKAMKIRQTSF